MSATAQGYLAAFAGLAASFEHGRPPNYRRKMERVKSAGAGKKKRRKVRQKAQRANRKK